MLVEKKNKRTFSKHIQIFHLETSKRNCWTEKQKRRKSGIKTERQKQRAHHFGATTTTNKKASKNLTKPNRISLLVLEV